MVQVTKQGTFLLGITSRRSPDTFHCPRQTPGGWDCALTPPAMAAVSPWLLAGDQDTETASLPPQVSSLRPEQWEQPAGHAELAALGCSPEKLRFAPHILLSPAPLLQK